MGTEREITEYGTPLALVTSFKYLGRALSEADDDWTAVVHNLQISRQKWVWLSRVLRREEADSWTLGKIYVAVVHVVMLYRTETWVMTPHTGRVLGGFRHRVACSLMGRQPRIGRDGGWVYPPLEEAMTEAGL